MNILLSLKKFSHIGYYIHEARTKAKERKKHHRDRLNLSNDQIKYLDKVVIPEGCSYQVNDHTFSSIDKALAYCKRLSIERCKKIWGAGIPISITNPNAPKIFDCACLPAGLLVKDSKDFLCRYAPVRIIIIAVDLSEVYTEYFDLYESDIFSNEHLYDYGLLYGNYPVYQETELCLSKFSEQYTKQINTPFVTEPAFGDPSKEYTGLMDVHMAYDCYSVEVLSDGTVYDDGNYAFPLGAIPVSTFVNIGSAGVYCKCWNLFWGCSRSFEVNGKEHSLFRSALLACKQSELPVGKEFYTIIMHQKEADGIIPADSLPVSLRDSYSVMTPHAKKRVFHISPQFDEIYWETFELADSSGNIRNFCYDHWLLDHNCEWNVGDICKTTYWGKSRWGNPCMDRGIKITYLPDAKTPYYGRGDLELYCKISVGSNSLNIPLSTLIKPSSTE